MNGTEHIIIQDRLTGVSAYAGYLCHAYCHRGHARLTSIMGLTAWRLVTAWLCVAAT